MTTYDWPTIRADAIARFGGDAPRAELEQQIIDVFEQQPQLVVLAIDKIADGYQAGRIRSPWAVLKTHIERAAEPGAPIQAEDTTQKQKRIQRAEQWVRAAGIHFDRQTEILLELFGPSGLLHAYAQVDDIQDGTNDDGHPVWTLTDVTGDLALVDRMTALWNQHRPAGIKLEQEADERAAKWNAQQAARQSALTQAHAEVQTQITEREPVTVGADDDIPF